MFFGIVKQIQVAQNLVGSGLFMYEDLKVVVMWYLALDYFLSLLHLIIIGFNLIGWIWKATRKLHFIVVLLTAFSWLVLGIWYGIGYCPITDWQWQVKKELGERNLPNSYIKYALDKLTGADFDPTLIDSFTAIGFVLVAVLSVYLNFFRGKASVR